MALTQEKKGIFCMVGAMFVFMAANTFLKTAEQVYAPTQIVFFRHLFSLIPYTFFMIYRREQSTLNIKNTGTHMARGLLGVISLSCLFQSIIVLPLSTAVTLSYACVFFIVLLSVPLLKEPMNKREWGCIFLGFFGVIISMNPSLDIVNWGAIYALCSAFLEAFLMVQSRQLTKENSNSALVFYYSLFALLFSGITLPFVWITPTSYDLSILCWLGIGGGIGQYLITMAYRYTAAGILAPLIYTSLLWSLGFGYFTLGEIPTIPLLLGAPFIIIAGLLNVLPLIQQNQGSSGKRS